MSCPRISSGVIRDWERIAESEPYFGMLARGKVHRWATADDVIAQMDADGIAQSLIFGFPSRSGFM